MDDITAKNSENSNPNPKPDHHKNFSDVWRDLQVTSGRLINHIGHFLHDITDIKEGLDEQGTKVSIQKNIQIKGSNIWLLMSAIMVASLGLNLNSPAVIIGAMLISPLMSPILGIGLSVGINDRSTLYQSMYHFAIAIAVSLITSALYFAITPLSGEHTSEILARTSPTLLDVLVAFFGGIAGIVSGSRAEKSNAIPGVAIATALLPPLCVSGYGLANGEWTIFFNSFYLFFLNSVFIALATYLIVRLLGFKMKQYQNPKEQNRSTWIVFVFVALVVVPSIFILRGVMEKVNRERNAKYFVSKFLMDDDRDVDYECLPFLNSKGEETDSSVLKVSILGDTISRDSIQYFQSLLPTFNLRRTGLKIIQTHSENYSKLLEERDNNFSKEKEIYQTLVNDKEAKINYLYQYIDSLKSPTASLNGLELLYPNLENMQYGVMVNTTGDKKTTLPTLTLKWKPNTSARYRQNTSDILGQYTQQRLGLDTIQVLQQ